ncbi:phage major capsid protein [Turicibacter sanguinis]|jgi:HK97 family phage major capsid protein|nr:phage major capsid protein [Turicibacter sanguinis]MTN51281.1 phage major capsid protein [Turicibacter sanguinis]MTN54430.1 phage major capsid protein [Turicibacter sanguinis]MTN57563.1 phage major capsid protein [Turicibacter sanguinis]MTN60628.1 phage major capsid protein [Turicibacter sanguinis]
MKKKLEEMLQKKEARKAELVEQSKTSEDVVELRSIHAEMDGLNDEIAELRGMLAALPNEDNQVAAQTSEEPQARSFNPIATYSTGNQTIKRHQEEDIYATVEYRTAFMNYVTKGTPIPEEYRNQNDEARSNELTVVGDVAAVVPTNLLNQVIEDITVEGKILARVTQTSLKGGVEIPISEINPTATWLNSESTTSDEQKAKMAAKISFGYHVLEAKVALGLLTATVSLPVFEATVVKQLKKAMLRAIEASIVEGTGSGQPLGFTKFSNLPEDQIVTFTADTIGTVAQWAEAEAAIPEAHEDSVIYVMSKKTWEKYLNGMTDSTGQKIGLGRINEKGQKLINGREVLTTDRFPGFDKCDDEGIFGAIIDLSQYMLNSNLAMYYKKYFNEDTNKWIHKALMIVDGKMAAGNDSTGKLVGAEGLIYLKKGASLLKAAKSGK